MSNDSQKTILLVEDEALIAEMEKRALEKHGYRVIAVLKGEKAVEIVRDSQDIDLILMDINLGSGMDGIRSAEIILGIREIPLMFISSHTEKEIVEKTQSISSYGYIVKTYDESILLASVTMAFRLFDMKVKEKEQNDRLRENEKYLAEAQRVAKLGYWNFDIASNSVFWSDELFHVFEADRESFQGVYGSFLDHVHPDDRSLVVNMNKHTRETGESFVFEYRINSKNGRIKYIREVGYATKNEKGEIVGLFGTAQDITDIRMMNDALRESEMKWNSLVKNSPDFIGIYDKEEKYLFLNRFPEGYTEEDVIGTCASDYVAPEQRDLWKSCFGECLLSGTTKVVRCHGIGARRKQRIYETYFSRLTDRFSESTVMILSKDITDQAMAEEYFRKQQSEKEMS